MDETMHATLQGWHDYYLVTGTAAASLAGLQFVVQTLLASDELRPVAGRDPEAGVKAFGTPTVVHFAIALVVSAMMCVPWPQYASLRVTLGVLGVGALAYATVVLRRARQQRTYRPVIQDWVWYIGLPAAAYAALLLGGALFASGAQGPPFVIAAATLLLVCVGIHNAWDTVTYLTLNALRTDATKDETEQSPRGPNVDAASRPAGPGR